MNVQVIDPFSLLTYLDTMAGGPLWKDIKIREREYWNSVILEDGDRVDLVDKVGGLLDITDVIGYIQEYVSTNKFEGVHIVGRLSDHNRYMIEHRANPNLQRLVSETLVDTDNMAIAGGCPLSLLTGLPTNDVDIFLPAPGLVQEELTQLVRRQVSTKTDEDGYHTSTEHAVSAEFMRELVHNLEPYYIPYKFQVILRQYHSLTEILMGFDIGACGVAIYKGRLYATERALYEIMNNVIMISTNPEDETLDRASTTYLRRLIKYLHKGFNIHVEGVQLFEHPPRDFYTNMSNISVISSLEYLLGMYKYSHSSSRLALDIKSNLRQARKNSPSIKISTNSSDYDNDNITRGPNWLIYGKADRRGYYIVHRNGDKAEVNTNRSCLLEKIKFITVKPYRQGSLSHDPIIVSLADWAGNNHVIYGPTVMDAMSQTEPSEREEEVYRTALINISVELSKADMHNDMELIKLHIEDIQNIIYTTLDNRLVN